MEKKTRTFVTLNIEPQTRAALKVLAALEQKTVSKLVAELAASEYKRREASGLLRPVR